VALNWKMMHFSYMLHQRFSNRALPSARNVADFEKRILRKKFEKDDTFIVKIIKALITF